MPFGVTPTGFNAMTEADVLAAIEADERADLSQTLDLSESSVLGKVNRIMARYLAGGWAAAKATHDGADPNLVHDDQATSLAKITGTSRRGSSASQVDVTVELERDTKLEAGTHFAHVTGRPDLRWTPLADIRATDPGLYTTRWRAELTGSIDTPIDSIAVVATPVVGWKRVVTSGEVEVGRSVDDDEDLFVRREQGLARAGSATLAGIRSDLLAIDAAVSAQVFENYTDDVDAQGLPPKSFECVIYAVNATNDQVAQAIWDSRPSGIQPIGSVSGTALDADGTPRVVPFSRPDQVEVFITYELQQRDYYVGDETFKQTVATLLDARMQSGQEVSEFDVAIATHGLGVRLRKVTFGLAPNPTSSDEIAVGTKQIARFDPGRLVLT